MPQAPHPHSRTGVRARPKQVLDLLPRICYNIYIMRNLPIIAIDGPAGSGKSTAARNLARALGFRFLDTGAMYRAVTWKAIRDGIDLNDDEAMVELTGRTRLRLEPVDGMTRVFVDGVEVSDEIRSEAVSRAVYHVAGSRRCRGLIVGMQREFAAEGGVVAEGRDIGTVVFPDAELKFFLMADARERARRRVAQLAVKGERANVDDVLRDIEMRDRRDSERAVSPLKQAPDAIVVDTTDNSEEETLAVLVEEARKRME